MADRTEYKTSFSGMMMRELPETERPREKLLSSGASGLSNAELMAILLSSGSTKESVMGLAQRVLSLAGGGLSDLLLCSAEDLKKINGIGDAKACTVLAAIELGRRIASAPAASRLKVSCPEDAAGLFMEDMRHLRKEVFCVAMLNVKNEVIGKTKVSVGGISSAPAHPREVFEEALRRGACSIILAHNHPSGDPLPSDTDKELTGRLADSGELLGIPVLDHIIIGDGKYFSFKEQDLMQGS